MEIFTFVKNEKYEFKSEILYNTISRRKNCSLFAYGWRKGGKNRPWCLALVTPSVASDANAYSPGYNGWSSYCAYLPFFLCLSLFVLRMLSSFTYILTHLSSEVFQDSCTVYRCCSTDSTMTCGSVFQMPVNSTNRKLKKIKRTMSNIGKNDITSEGNFAFVAR